jgi:predicted phosphate transport protein (TIGR00153 family)
VFPRPRRNDPQLLALLEECGGNAERAARQLQALIADYPDRAELADDVRELEHEGDRIAHDILRRVAERGPRRTPFDPVDIQALVTALDDIVDYAEEAADQLGLYAVEAPMEQAVELAAVLVEATTCVAASLRVLRENGDLTAHLVEIHRIENVGDRVGRAAVASLFAHGIDPMFVIRWKDIFATLERAIDACETVANVLEGMALKRRARR